LNYLKHNISETGFCLRLLAKPIQLGPIWDQSIELVPIHGLQHQHKIAYISLVQHKPSARVKANIKNVKRNFIHMGPSTYVRQVSVRDLVCLDSCGPFTSVNYKYFFLELIHLLKKICFKIREAYISSVYVPQPNLKAVNFTKLHPSGNSSLEESYDCAAIVARNCLTMFTTRFLALMHKN
jgi:hypothetical protein